MFTGLGGGEVLLRQRVEWEGGTVLVIAGIQVSAHRGSKHSCAFDSLGYLNIRNGMDNGKSVHES